MYIRLTDYREVISRRATDDLLVAHYLLRHAVTLLSKAVKTREPQSRKEEIALSESLRSIGGFVANALNILIDLRDAGKVKIPPSSIDCYEDLFDEGVNKYGSPKVHVGHFASLTLGGGSSMLVSQSMITPMSADAEWRQSLRIRPPAFRLENHACAP